MEETASYYSTKCATCKFFEQGEACSYCGNPKQEDDGLKKYCYYDFGCDLHEKGTAQSRIEYMTRNDRFDYYNDVVAGMEARGANALKALLVCGSIVGGAALLIYGCNWLQNHFG